MLAEFGPLLRFIKITARENLARHDEWLSVMTASHCLLMALEKRVMLEDQGVSALEELMGSLQRLDQGDFLGRLAPLREALHVDDGSLLPPSCH